MATYEDGIRECKQLLLNEAEGLDHAAALEGDSNPGRIFAAQASYFRLLVTQLEQRRVFREKIGAFADGDTAIQGDSDVNLWFGLRRELETSDLPSEQLKAFLERWTEETRTTAERLRAGAFPEPEG